MPISPGTDLMRNLPMPLLFGGLFVPTLMAMLLTGGDPVIGLLVFAVIVAAGLALQFPQLGLIGMAALTVTNVSDNLIQNFDAPSLAKLAGPGLLFILGARWAALREAPFVNGRALLFFALYGLVMALSATWATSWGQSLGTATDFLKDVLIVMLTLAFFNRPGALSVYLNAAMAFLATICILCFYQYVTGDFSNDFAGFARFLYDSKRLSGPINDPNFFAATLVFFVPLALGQILFSTRWVMRIVGALMFAVFMTAILLTASRGALVAVAASLALFFLILDRRTILPAAAIGVVLICGVALALSDTLIERFELIFSPLDQGVSGDPAIEGRLASWTVAVDLFLRHPLGGVGAGNYNLSFQDTALDLGLIFRGEGRSAHSLYLEILAETGLVGLTAFLLMVFAAATGVLESIRRLRDAGLNRLARQHATFGIGLVGYLVAMIFLHDSYPRLLYTLLAIGIALPRIARIERAATPADQVSPAV